MSSPSGPPSAVEQHCYRHADRRAGVSCQRCDRPICPSCMISASVGFQCPECAKSGAKQQRLVDTFRKQSVPQLTYALIGVNVAVFLVAMAVGLDKVNAMFGLQASPARYLVSRTSVVDVSGVAHGEWWRIFTSGFLHGSFIHLGLNMYVLYLIGGAMEPVIGRARLALVYVVSLVGGSLGALLLTPDSLTVGASGAIFGLFAVLACLQLSRGQNPMQGGIGPTILLNLALTFVFGFESGAGGVQLSIGGHLGGLVAGAICGSVLFGLNPVQARQRHGNANLYNGLVASLGVVLLVGAVGAGVALGS
jgi:membrane associated rhomboid family serine protease